MSLRRIVSLTLLLSALLMLTSSIVLYIVPHGRIAYWADWKLWSLSKTQWGNLHTNAGLLMLIAACLHVWYNWRPITSYLKNKARQVRLFTPNFNAALVLTAAFVVLTLAEVPPLAWVQDLGESIKDGGSERLGEPPYGHAELSSLRVFLRNTGQDATRAKENLEAAGVTGITPEISIVELAHSNGMSPRELHAVMLGPENERASVPLPLPETLPMGSGRRTLADFCGQYNRDPADAVRVLEAAGWQADAQSTLKEIATANGKEALDLVDVLRRELPAGGE